MKKIGFIDFYLDEWHANNYPEWIRENAKNFNRNVDVAYAWAEIDKQDGLSTSEWCNQYRVQALPSIEEVVEKSDYLIVLSPDNPEHHESLGELALISGKPVYMDKTFSPDLASGKRMFELAEKYNTPLLSSSALRFSKELGDFPNEKVNQKTLKSIATTGPGTYENYSVHQFEIIVSQMGTGAKRMKRLDENTLIIDYEDGRHASFSQEENAPFQIEMKLQNGEEIQIPDCTDMFPRLIDSILTFFENGISPVSKEETLGIMALIETGKKTLLNKDVWIDLVK